MSVGVLFVHGMGETKPGYSAEIQSLLRSYTSKNVYEGLVFQEAYYQNILQKNQERYFKAVKGRVDWDKLRQFMLYGFCDAASLESQKSGKKSPYYLAQRELMVSLKALRRRIGADAPVAIVAQSLGGQVVSNYLWDANKKTKTGKPALARDGIWSGPTGLSAEDDTFCRGNRVARFVTTGCNIPLFVAGRDTEKIEPIKPLNDDFKWLNYFDKDDVLGWPLSQLSPAYADAVTDKQMNAGVFAGFTPFSHVNYWDDRTFLKALGNELRKLSRLSMA